MEVGRRELLHQIVAKTRDSDDEASNGERIDSHDGEEVTAQSESDEEAERFCLYWDDGELCAVGTPGVFAVERYDMTRNIFSRNTGILETDIMATKRAVILGCGSVGSLVAAELAKAGVGHFLLIDMDVLEYHNICRHQCGVSDVGRRKPDAVRDLVLNINPLAQVETAYSEVQQISLQLLDAWCSPADTIVFGCADNRDVDRYANALAGRHGVPFLGIGFWERAFAGEVFYWLPGCGQACYTCAIVDDDGLSQRF